jgi:hypothetical protein
MNSAPPSSVARCTTAGLRAVLVLAWLVLTTVVACGSPKPRGCPDCDGGDGGGNGPSMPVLRTNIGVDLARIAFFAVFMGTSGSYVICCCFFIYGIRSFAFDGGYDFDGGNDSDGGIKGPGLYALTLSGDTLLVQLVEEGNPRASGGSLNQPQISAILPTPTWVLFSTPLYSVYPSHADGGSDTGAEKVICSLIAARRSDGALYCAPLIIGFGSGAFDDRYPLAQSNAAGDMVIAEGAAQTALDTPPDISSYYLYRIALSETEGPSATLATTIHPNFFLVNPASDFFVNYYPVPLDQATTACKVFPVGGGTPFTLAGRHDAFVTVGGRAAPTRTPSTPPAVAAAAGRSTARSPPSPGTAPPSSRPRRSPLSPTATPTAASIPSPTGSTCSARATWRSSRS